MAQPANSTPSLNSQAIDNFKYTWSEATTDFFKTKTNGWKAASYISFWASQTGLVPKGVGEFSTYLSNGKNFLSTLEIYQKATETWENAKKTLKLVTESVSSDQSQIQDQKIYKSAKETIRSGCSTVNNTCDAVEFFSKFMEVSATGLKAIKLFKAFSFTCTSFSSAIGVYDNWNAYNKVDLLDSAKSQKQNHHLINLAKDVSYLAVGIIGLAFIVTGQAVVPWMLLLPLTSGLFFTTVGTFNEKMYDPLNQGKNLNPDKVARHFSQNLVSQPA